jgi:peptide/nickel transport system ATP-binding protein
MTRLDRAGFPVLEVSGLCVDYGHGADVTHAVIDVDLVLHRGEVVGLAGESGSGKSTLAYGMTRLLRPPGRITAGRVLFRPDPDQPVWSLDLLDLGIDQLRQLRWREISIVFQSAMAALNPVLDVEAQLVDTLAAHRPEMSRHARHERAAELLRLVGISADRLRSFPHELSGGMRQRVMIAMALALEPQIVIMDEPTTALDVVTQREILQEVIELRDRLGFSVLFITHDLSLLLELADTIAVMYAGRIVEHAAADQLLTAPRHPYSLGLLSSFPSLHGPRRALTGIPGSPPDLQNLPKGCAFHPRCGYAMPRCSHDVPILSAPPGSPMRFVACWLQDGKTNRPEELSRPESGAGDRLPAAAVPAGSESDARL